MSAWSESLKPEAVPPGALGELVSVRITVEPRYLEDLLEALAGVSFPVNPQIFHQAVLVALTPDGRRESRAATLVEFPAYRADLEEVRAMLDRNRVVTESVVERSVLDDIQSGGAGRGDVPWLVWQDDGGARSR